MRRERTGEESSPLRTEARRLLKEWRATADVCEQRKRDAANANFRPGEDINRAKMLAYRDCADELELAFRALLAEGEG